MSTEWKEMTINRLEATKVHLNPKQQKGLKLDLLERIINRVDEFSDTCESCSTLQKEAVAMMVSSLTASNFNRKEYNRLMNGVVKHMKDEHKLHEEGENTSTYMALGMSLGMVFGMTVFKAMGLAIGLSLGMTIGMAIGSSMDKKNKAEGKCL